MSERLPLPSHRFKRQSMIKIEQIRDKLIGMKSFDIEWS